MTKMSLLTSQAMEKPVSSALIVLEDLADLLLYINKVFLIDVARTLGEYDGRVENIETLTGLTTEELQIISTEVERLSNEILALGNSQSDEINPLFFANRGSGVLTTINQAFPSITLTQVQELNPSATLSDSADWYVLQKLINNADSLGYKKIIIPAGVYLLSKPLDLVEKASKLRIDASGCILEPTPTYDGILVKISRGTNYSKSRNLHIIGLSVDGKNRSTVGVEIHDGLEWYLEHIKIYNCHVGLSLSDVWYGEFTGECVIQDCLIGIQMNEGDFSEVNTVDFRNLKINCGAYFQKTSFIAKNVGETDVDYNNRVRTIAIHIKTKVYTCKFNGITIEGVDYGYLTEITNGTASQVDHSVYSITENYFEAIGKHPFYIAPVPGYINMTTNLTISGCRVNGPQIGVLSCGVFSVKSNEYGLSLDVRVSDNGQRTVLNTDISKDNLIYNPKESLMFISSSYIPTSINAFKINPFGDDDVYPKGHNTLENLQDYKIIEHISKFRVNSYRTQNTYVLSMHSKSLTLLNKNLGLIIQGDDDKYYMQRLNTSLQPYWTEVMNLNRIDPPVSGMTSKEMYRKPSIEGESIFNIDLEAMVTFKNGVWKANIGYADEFIAIGTTLDIINSAPSVNVLYVWNLQLDNALLWINGNWTWATDWFGNAPAHRPIAIGLMADRPIDPLWEGFIFYATDQALYYKWDNTAKTYSQYVPVF